jgi:hypothetical protein
MTRVLFAALLGIIFVTGMPPNDASAQNQTAAERAGDIVFDEVQKRLIRDYFGDQTTGRYDKDRKHKDKMKGRNKGHKGKSKQMPPGLAKKDKLPPGLQKQLQRKGTLPPGLAKRDLPYDLESRLGALPPDTERVLVDNDVVLIRKSTGIILDVLYDVLGGAN